MRHYHQLKSTLIMLLSILSALSILSTSSLWAIKPTSEEMEAKNRWIAAKFDGLTEKLEPLTVGIEVIRNYDPLQMNSRNGSLMKIGDQFYEKGLYCHAQSELVIRLPKPGKKLTAIIGVDHNGDTSGGRGSIQFSVESSGQKIFESGIMRGGEAGVPIEVDLNNAKEFKLLVSDAGDGISCDQADWALATVLLDDNSTIQLGDLRVNEQEDDQTYEPNYPFSFIYNGKPSASFLKDWNLESATQINKEKNIREKTLIFTEPDGPLQVICKVTDYLDFPTVEWTLNFKNLSEKETSIIEDIRVIDTVFSRDLFFPRPVSGWDPECGDAARYNTQKEFLLHHFVGSPCRADDYMPLATTLGNSASKTITTSGGRPTNSDLPYFNIQADQKGWIVVLGWSGQWSAQFNRVNARGLQVQAGQEKTHFKLLPLEEVRSPIAVVQPWFRDSWFDAQNIWRSWMIQHNVPRQPNGDIIDHHLAACSSHYFTEMTQADSQSQIDFIDNYIKKGIPLDYWWMDAGWYPCENNWGKTGTWEVDQTRFPGGFRPITNHGREKGVQSIVWFEPERVAGDTWLTQNHPDWILGGKNGGLLNLGNLEARNWLIDHIDNLIKKEGIDFYRQDFNMDPLDYWRNNDSEDRQGITEIRHIEGYLAYWDALLERNPGLRIDSCASGGRRNDLETMRRAVPLLRSDYLLEPVSQQIHTYGISLWIPFFGTGTKAFDDYKIRSILPPYFNLCYDIRDDSAKFEILRNNLTIWREVLVPLFDADFYPLTQISERNDVWVGWQYNDEEAGNGAIQMFRRADSVYTQGLFKLRGLDLNAHYEFQNVDSKQTFRCSGKELTEKGLLLEIDQAPQAVIYSYRKVD
ncbi:MAG: alpha-galactosidase [Planctomycetia bacterium]|nr:alpha-galactosidase [Planctomycetia bacterium]